MAQCENDVINMGLFFFLFGIHTNSEHLPVTHEHHPVLWKRLELARIAPETTLPGPRRNGNPDSPDPASDVTGRLSLQTVSVNFPEWLRSRHMPRLYTGLNVLHPRCWFRFTVKTGLNHLWRLGRQALQASPFWVFANMDDLGVSLFTRPPCTSMKVFDWDISQ